MASSNHSSVPAGFKEIPGYNGRYFISQEGQVWSALSSKILSQHFDAPKHYLTVLINQQKGKRARPKKIHCLMGIAWLGEAPGTVGIGGDKYCINHKDGNKLNNHVDNLEWITNSENLCHAWENNLHAHGENCSQSQFTSEQVREIRLRLLLGKTVKMLAEEFEVSIPSIKKIQQYVAWKRQDWDLVKPMMQICNSKYLQITIDCINDGGKFYDYSRPNSR
jgi:hypothetical protein